MGLELLTNEEMARADAAAISSGVPPLSLMEHAGRAVADAARAMVPVGARVLVLCGPGNNGGDGFVAARHLKHAYDVRVYLLGLREALKGDAAEMARRWGGPIRSIEPGITQSMDLVIDAVFGAGLKRALDGDVAMIANEVIEAGLPVLAVDVPSGLNGTTGMAAGPVIPAEKTVTFFRRKPGHLLMPGRTFCGETIVADIGIPDAVLAQDSRIGESTLTIKTFANEPGLWSGHFPWPKPDGHKYDRGHAVVVSGPADSTGAARLGARGALRIGAGLVTVVSPPDAMPVNSAHLTAIMLKSAETTLDLFNILADERKNAVLIGPGRGVSVTTASEVVTLLGSKAAFVLDADALSSFDATAGGNSSPRLGAGSGTSSASSLPPTAATLFKSIAERDAPVVMTPHDGEFARLFADIEGAHLDRAREAASRAAATIILKGPDTVIASPDGRAAINENAPPSLATAGSGDVLAGFVAGLLAQHMPAFEAACAAVWVHGECARKFGPGLIAEDLPETVPDVLKALAPTA